MDELEIKRQRLHALMAEHRLDAVFLCQVANFAWYTGGLEPVVMLSSDRAEAGLLITPERQYVVSNSVEYPRLRDEDRLGEQGYQFHFTPWYHGMPAFDELVAGKRWAADWPIPGALDLSAEIARLRFELTPPEVEHFRWLGQHTALALEQAAGLVQPGMSEMHIAGLVAGQAFQAGITPTLLLVGTDERIFRYRHPIPSLKPLERYAMLVICGRRWGLVASATRLVHFGHLPQELVIREAACAYVDAVYNAATVVGARVSDIFQSAVHAYADAGFPGEWEKHNQGGSAGYMSRDYEGTPACEETVLGEQAFAWNPSITGVKSEDTVIVHPHGLELLTVSGQWPSIRVEVDGVAWERPAILVK